MALFPLGGSNVPIRREMITLNSHSVVRMEGKVNNVIQKAIDSEYLLKKKNKNKKTLGAGKADSPKRRN